MRQQLLETGWCIAKDARDASIAKNRLVRFGSEIYYKFLSHHGLHKLRGFTKTEDLSHAQQDGYFRCWMTLLDRADALSDDWGQVPKSMNSDCGN
eukprot:11579695-Karenia_brevis.AAC.1